jgi:hypothetical protein
MTADAPLTSMIGGVVGACSYDRRMPDALPIPPDQTPLVSAPAVDNDRGFHLYGGRPIPTANDHTITVRESSAASGPHVWLFISADGTEAAHPHLDLAQAIALREALGQFIDSTPTRWERGDQKLADATRTALG